MAGIHKYEHAALAVLIVVCLLTAAFDDSARQVLRFERSGLGERGEYWRILTAHVVHLGWAHTLFNLVALGLIWQIFRDFLTLTDWVVGTLVAALAISAGLYVLDPNVQWYVGLSGVLHGLFTLGALAALGRQPGVAALMLFALAAKLAYEQWWGALPSTRLLDVGPVVVNAHLYGAAGGVIAYAMRHGYRWLRASL